MELQLRPYGNEQPITLCIGDIYVFCNAKYRERFVGNITNADYIVSKAYFEHITKFGNETVITEAILSNPHDNIELLKFIRVYGKVKAEESSADIWQKLEGQCYKELE